MRRTLGPPGSTSDLSLSRSNSCGRLWLLTWQLPLARPPSSIGRRQVLTLAHRLWELSSCRLLLDWQARASISRSTALRQFLEASLSSRLQVVLVPAVRQLSASARRSVGTILVTTRTPFCLPSFDFPRLKTVRAGVPSPGPFS